MNKQYSIVNGVAVNHGIGWCTHTSNPIRYRDKRTGKPVNYCQKISQGCAHCYAERLGKRFGSPDFTVPNLAQVEPFIDEQELRNILTMRTSRHSHGLGVWPAPHTRPSLFIGDMSDYFGDWVPFEMIDRVMAVAALRPDITFMLLTKRAERMVEYLDSSSPQDTDREIAKMDILTRKEYQWPLPNVMLGFSAEDQENFDARWSHMRKLAAMGWRVYCSYEPALGEVDFTEALEGGIPTDEQLDPSKNTLACHYVRNGAPQLSWLIIGGESGPKARPFDIAWMRSAIQQCRAAGVACWAKQVGRRPVQNESDMHRYGGAHACEGVKDSDGKNLYTLLLEDSHGADWDEWSEDLRVRELPEVTR